jgi:transcriptional regulator with XRE-family HTH domain
MSLGRLLRDRRKELQLSQERLALESGIGQEAISRLEKGGLVRSPLPAPEALLGLARMLEVTPEQLMRAAGYDVGETENRAVAAAYLDRGKLRRELRAMNENLQRALALIEEANSAQGNVVRDSGE